MKIGFVNTKVFTWHRGTIVVALTVAAALILQQGCAGAGGVNVKEIQGKVNEIERLLPDWAASGGDPEEVGRRVQRFQELMRSGKPKEAEAQLDEALALLKSQERVPPAGVAEEKPLTPRPGPASETKYLTFQIFTSDSDPKIPVSGSSPLLPPPSKRQIATFVQNIIDTIGTTGNKNYKLGFTVGPLALDNTDEELRRLIRESFEIAQEKDVAVGFHIDDSMFWKRRNDLWSNPANVEWTDWNGKVHPQRYVGWIHAKLAPQMCYTSPALRKEIGRIARDVIGKEIRKGMDNLKANHKEHLFAGVIAGWETHIFNYRDIEIDSLMSQRMERDGSPKVRVGYCALSNLGFSAAKPPEDFDYELRKVVQDWIAFWAKELNQAGIPKERIYTHVKVMPAKKYLPPYAQKVLWTGQDVPWTAFNPFSRPGFSVYTIGLKVKAKGPEALLATIYEELEKQGSPHWAVSEGANVKGQMSGLSAEAYLISMFNYGATVVNIFAWGVGGDALKNDPFRVATQGEEAIKAYKKLLEEGSASEVSGGAGAE